MAAGGLPGNRRGYVIGQSRRWSGGRAGGRDDARGLRLAGLVLPADRDAVAGVVLPQRRLELLRRRDALPVHRDDHVALGEASRSAAWRAGDDPGDGGPGACLHAAGCGAVSGHDLPRPGRPVGPMCTVAEDGARLDLVGDRLRLADGDGEGLRLLALELRSPCEAAVLMPMTCPAVLTSGPPESPGWMPALWWMSPVSCSGGARPSSEAVIDAPRPAMWPVATAGVPPLPSALPSATTFWPAGGAGGVAQGHRLQAGCALQLEHGDVVAVVVADDLGLVGAAVADVARP